MAALTHNHDCLLRIGSAHLIERHPLIRKAEEDYPIAKVSANVHEGSPGKVLAADKRIPLINGALTTGCYGTLATGPGLGKEFEVYVFNEKIRKLYSAIRVVTHVVTLPSRSVIEQPSPIHLFLACWRAPGARHVCTD